MEFLIFKDWGISIYTPSYMVFLAYPVNLSLSHIPSMYALRRLYNSFLGYLPVIYFTIQFLSSVIHKRQPPYAPSISYFSDGIYLLVMLFRYSTLPSNRSSVTRSI